MFTDERERLHETSTQTRGGPKYVPHGDRWIPSTSIGVAMSLVCASIVACAHPAARPAVPPGPPPRMTMNQKPALIPWPLSVALVNTDRLALEKAFAIEVTPAEPDLQRIGRELAELIRPAIDATIPVRDLSSTPVRNTIRLEIGPTSTDVGDEGYELTISATDVRIRGSKPAGVFYGVQTLRQLLPASVEFRAARPHALTIPTGHIVDRPRYVWRGAMLDVARHFFAPADVKRYIDLLALYKFNQLHLHLSDDQGWRVEIDAWPNLTTRGGSTAVGGGAGGFYTKKDYADLVEYARTRFVTIVPEIDMPSHINAALASYPELNCDGNAPSLYTGIEVGFSSFCVEKDITYKFIDDVVREIAAMTSGPYFHIGGDEVKKLTPPQYARFMERAQEIVQKNGKQSIGWDEIAHSTLLPTTVVQYWRPDASVTVPPSTKLILSPANRIYLDMKYDDATKLGLNWAGNVDVSVPYEWNPATLLPKVPETSLLGIEAPIWSETLASMSDLEFMAFPRIAAVAEVGWSVQSSREWSDFKARLAAQAPRWAALGVNAYWSERIEWQR